MIVGLEAPVRKAVFCLQRSDEIGERVIMLSTAQVGPPVPPQGAVVGGPVAHPTPRGVGYQHGGPQEGPLVPIPSSKAAAKMDRNC